jgi:DNA-binding transcriptional ArsR family regulator
VTASAIDACRLTCRQMPAYTGATPAGNSMDADKVFKALGDPTRRKLLDLLYESNGQTLTQLCEHLDMARQSATQHIGLLEDANLVVTVWRGREKLHFINPVPLQEVYERWVRKFERQRLGLLHDLKKELEGE